MAGARQRLLSKRCMIKTKSVLSKVEPDEDGLRILVARGRGRGLPSSQYDVWMPNLGPSEHLRDAYLAGKISWNAYAQRYRRELRLSDSFDKANRHIRNHGQKFTLRLLQHLARDQNVTLLCHCAETEQQCHRHLLREVLTKPIS